MSYKQNANFLLFQAFKKKYLPSSWLNRAGFSALFAFLLRRQRLIFMSLMCSGTAAALPSIFYSSALFLLCRDLMCRDCLLFPFCSQHKILHENLSKRGALVSSSKRSLLLTSINRRVSVKHFRLVPLKWPFGKHSPTPKGRGTAQAACACVCVFIHFLPPVWGKHILGTRLVIHDINAARR